MGGAEGCWATVSTMMTILHPQHHSQQVSPHGLPLYPLVLCAHLVTTGPLHKPFMPLLAASHPAHWLLLQPLASLPASCRRRQKVYLCYYSQVVCALRAVTVLFDENPLTPSHTPTILGSHRPGYSELLFGGQS